HIGVQGLQILLRDRDREPFGLALIDLQRLGEPEPLHDLDTAGRLDIRAPPLRGLRRDRDGLAVELRMILRRILESLVQVVEQALPLVFLAESLGDEIDLLVHGRQVVVAAFGNADSRGDLREPVVTFLLTGAVRVEDEVGFEGGDRLVVGLHRRDDLRSLVIEVLGPRTDTRAAEFDPVGSAYGLDAEGQGGLGISPPQGDDPLRIGGDIAGPELRSDAGSGRVGRFGVASAAAGEDEEGGEDRGEYSAHDFLFTSLGEPSLIYLRPSEGMPAADGPRAGSPRSGRGPVVSSRRGCRAV